MPNLLYRALLGRFYTIAPSMTRVQLAASLSAIAQLGFNYDSPLAIKLLNDLEQQQLAALSATSTVEHNVVKNGSNASENNNGDESPLEDPDGTHRKREPLNDDDVVDEISASDPPAEDVTTEQLIHQQDESELATSVEAPKARRLDDEKFFSALFLEDLPHLRGGASSSTMNVSSNIAGGAGASGSSSASSSVPPFSYKASAPANIWTCLRGYESGLLSLAQNLPNASSSLDSNNNNNNNSFFLDILSDILSKPAPVRDEFLLAQQLALFSALCGPMLEGSLSTLFSTRRGRELTRQISQNFVTSSSSSSNQRSGTTTTLSSFAASNGFFLSWQDEPSVIQDNIRLLQILTASPFATTSSTNKNNTNNLQQQVVNNIKLFLEQHKSVNNNANKFAIPDNSWMVPLLVLIVNNKSSSSSTSSLLLPSFVDYIQNVVLAKGLVLEDDRYSRLVVLSLEIHQQSMNISSKNNNDDSSASSSSSSSAIIENLTSLQEHGILPSLDDADTLEMLSEKFETAVPLLLVIDSLLSFIKNTNIDKDTKNDKNSEAVANVLSACVKLFERMTQLQKEQIGHVSSIVHPSLLLTCAEKYSLDYAKKNTATSSKSNPFLEVLCDISTNTNNLTMFTDESNVVRFVKLVLGEDNNLDNNVKTVDDIIDIIKKLDTNNNNKNKQVVFGAIDTFLASRVVANSDMSSSSQGLIAEFEKLTDKFPLENNRDESALACLPLTSTILLQELALIPDHSPEEVASITRLLLSNQQAKLDQSEDNTTTMISSIDNNCLTDSVLLAIIELLAVLKFSSTEECATTLRGIFGSSSFSASGCSLSVQLALKSFLGRVKGVEGIFEDIIEENNAHTSKQTEEASSPSSEENNQLQTSSAAIAFAEKIKIAAASTQQQQDDQQQQAIDPTELATNLEPTAGTLRDRLALLVVLVEHMPDRVSSLLHPVSVERILHEASIVYGFGTLRSRSLFSSMNSNKKSSRSGESEEGEEEVSRSFSSRQSVSLREYKYALGCLVRICSGLSQAVGFETNNIINTNATGEFTAQSHVNVEAAQREHFLFPAVQNIMSVLCEESGDLDSLSTYGVISMSKVLNEIDKTGEKIGDLNSCRVDVVGGNKRAAENTNNNTNTSNGKIFDESNVEGLIAPGFLLPPMKIFVSLFQSAIVHSTKFNLTEWEEILQAASFALSVYRTNNSSVLVSSPAIQSNFEQTITSLRRETLLRAQSLLKNVENKSSNNTFVSVCKLLGKTAGLFESVADTSLSPSLTSDFSDAYLLSQILDDLFITKTSSSAPSSSSLLSSLVFFPKSVVEHQDPSKIIEALKKDGALKNEEFEAALSLLATIHVAKLHGTSATNNLRILRGKIFAPLARFESSVLPSLASVSALPNTSSSFVLVKSLLSCADTAAQHVTAMKFLTEWISARSFSSVSEQQEQQEVITESGREVFSFDQHVFPFYPNLLIFMRNYFENNLYISGQDPDVTAAAEQLIAKLIDVQLEALHGAELFDVVTFTLTLHCASKLGTIQELDAASISDALERFVDAARYRVDCIPVAIVAFSRLCPNALTPEHLETLLSPLISLLNSTYLLKTETGVLNFWANSTSCGRTLNLASTVAEEFLSELVFALARIPAAGAFDSSNAGNLTAAVVSAESASTAEEHQLPQLLPSSSASGEDAENINNNSGSDSATTTPSASLQSKINVAALIRELADIAVEHSNRFVSGRSIARLMRGLSSFRLLNRDIYRVFSSRLKIRPILNSVDRSDVSLICSSFASGKFLDEKLFRKMAERICFQISGYNSADVVLCLRSFNSLHLQNDAVYDSLFNRATQIAPSLSATSCVEILHILALQGSEASIAYKTCNQLTEAIIEQTEKNPNLLTADELVKVLVAFAALDYSDMDQSQKLIEKLTENFSSLSDDGLKTLCALMIDRNWRDDDVLSAMSEQALKLYSSGMLKPEAARCVLDTAGYFLFHDDTLRLTLSETARTVSREVPPPDEGDDDEDGSKMITSSSDDDSGKTASLEE